MATIKGQNLRVTMDDGTCFAKATSCTLHIALETADTSSKDDDNSFACIEPVGVNWDVSVDALVTDGYILNDKITTDYVLPRSLITLSHYYPVLLSLAAGDAITLTPTDNDTIVAVTNTSFTSLKTGDAGESITYVAPSDMQVYICSNTAGAEITRHLSDDGFSLNSVLQSLCINGETFTLTTTTGARNRVGQDLLLSGIAILTDLNVTAANRQTSTYTAQFQGTGPLTIEYE